MHQVSQPTIPTIQLEKFEHNRVNFHSHGTLLNMHVIETAKLKDMT